VPNLRVYLRRIYLRVYLRRLYLRVYTTGCIPQDTIGRYTTGCIPGGVPRWVYQGCIPERVPRWVYQVVYIRYMPPSLLWWVYIPGYMPPYHTPGYTTTPGTPLVTVLHSWCAMRGVRREPWAQRRRNPWAEGLQSLSGP